MGMTVGKIIEIYNEPGRISGTLIRGNSEEDTKYNSETIEAVESINVILHKYQKIVQIYQKWNDVNDFSYNQAMRKIGEVIEDGKID